MHNINKIKWLMYLLILAFIGLSCKHSLETETRPTVKNLLLKAKGDEAKLYCKAKNMNTSFCFLIDLSLHSGSSRFFVWNMEKDSIQAAFPVSHGCCNNIWSFTMSKERAKFSDLEGSHCSSLGKYKLGERGYSSWGIHIKYLMHGLDENNKNALKRQIVFHSWEKVPDDAVYPEGTPEGWGCPAISNANMQNMDVLLKTTSKPTLMWIFDANAL